MRLNCAEVVSRNLVQTETSQRLLDPSSCGFLCSTGSILTSGGDDSGADLAAISRQQLQTVL